MNEILTKRIEGNQAEETTTAHETELIPARASGEVRYVSLTANLLALLNSVIFWPFHPKPINRKAVQAAIPLFSTTTSAVQPAIAVTVGGGGGRTGNGMKKIRGKVK